MRTVPGALVDRVNIAGNETGQQSNFQVKATRPADATWTLDGVVITDMAAIGSSAGVLQLRQLRRDSGLDRGPGHQAADRRRRPELRRQARHEPVPRRAPRLLRPARIARGDSNVPDELAAIGVTPATADHNKQIATTASSSAAPSSATRRGCTDRWSNQDIRLVRDTGALARHDDDRETRHQGQLAGDQARHDLGPLVHAARRRRMDGQTGDAGILREAQTATWSAARIVRGADVRKGCLRLRTTTSSTRACS